MTLLVLLPWFLLFIGVALFGTLVVTTFCREKYPELSKWSSWTSITLGLLAVLVVIFSTRYLEISFGAKHTDEEPCGEFGMKRNPVTSDRKVSHLALVINYLLTNAEGIEKWACWSAAVLCSLAVLTFVFCIVYLLKDDKARYQKKTLVSYIEFVKNNTDQQCLKNSSKNKATNSEASKYFHLPKMTFTKKSRSYMWTSYVALSLFCAAIMGVILLNYSMLDLEKERVQPPCTGLQPQSQKFQDKPYISNSFNRTVGLQQRFFFVSRLVWLAEAPMEVSDLKHPTGYVVVSRTSEGLCSSHVHCVDVIKSLQMEDMELNGLWDIEPNFLLAGDDRIYEGRGWDVESPESSKYENGSLAVKFIGSYKRLPTSPNQLRSFDRLLELGIKLGKISSDYKIVADPSLIGSKLLKVLKIRYPLS